MQKWENYIDYLEENGMLKNYWLKGFKNMRTATGLVQKAVYYKLPGLVTKYTGKEGWWMGNNFKLNKLGWGGNQYTGARSAAKSLSTKIGVASKVLGAVTVVITGAEAINDFRHGNTKAGVIHTVDAVMGVVSLCGPVGTVVSTVYFVSRIFWGND